LVPGRRCAENKKERQGTRCAFKRGGQRAIREQKCLEIVGKSRGKLLVEEDVRFQKAYATWGGSWGSPNKGGPRKLVGKARGLTRRGIWYGAEGGHLWKGEGLEGVGDQRNI